MRNFSRISTFFSSIFVVSLLGLAPPAAAFGWGAKVTGSGIIKSETRDVNGFTGIALSVPAGAEIVQGSSEGIVFVAAMLLGMGIFEILERFKSVERPKMGRHV